MARVFEPATVSLLYLYLQLEVSKLYKASSPPENADQLIAQMELKMSAIKTRIDSWEKECTE